MVEASAPAASPSEAPLAPQPIAPTAPKVAPEPRRPPQLKVLKDATLKPCLLSTQVPTVRDVAQLQNTLKYLDSPAPLLERSILGEPPITCGGYEARLNDGKLHLCMGITGCILIHKNVFLIIEKLFDMYGRDKLDIMVVLTLLAEWFLAERLPKFDQLGVKVWFANDAANYYNQRKKRHPLTKLLLDNISDLGQYLLSWEIVRWTHVLLLAPLSANTLAKISNGLADNLLCDILHMWPTQNTQVRQAKPIVLALALTLLMYAHPITRHQVNLLRECFPLMTVLKPVEKCVDMDGNIAMGGMCPWMDVVDHVSRKLGPPALPDDDDDNGDDDGDNDEIREGDDDDDDNDDDDDDDDDNDDDDDDDEDGEGDDEDDSEIIVADATPNGVPKNGKVGDSSISIPSFNLSRKHLIPEVEMARRMPTPPPIIKEDAPHAGQLVVHRTRHNTISRKELEEHEVLALQNAIKNSFPV